MQCSSVESALYIMAHLLPASHLCVAAIRSSHHMRAKLADVHSIKSKSQMSRILLQQQMYHRQHLSSN